ncbi:palmitoyltransferase, putative [Plasmodium knowlesi strain H]|uniref:Palmitoyltransferase n=3 Tax=Plasmodium knowlesi TaxID=5850 RepID=A0A1A7VFN7_PLAKH|nr:palmitoyltransferase DHHC9, putative [Plasmodium knowlesi strain H]OTN65252.1 Palmitoyltransferase [Plasmodium knowlesi]CAA9988183.1 palmitoyltransferase DHHC9, putative [Plasmodium knowlesi strain H]SBO20097.1 palmitoyltransferase, putative [Plasmodium knowlesi strain H]SBO20689.1 palmitoyltransferase, putative [Plasmodium knowlesi strain H]VVS77657.1 palmitoyltransferase DHHC9, putative [Plasmodium knowlesi strain H]
MNNFLSFLFVTLLSAFIYMCYLYCLQNEYLNSYGRTVRIILGALSAPFFICYYWSFIKCSFNNPGYVDSTWEANAEENNIQIEKRKIRNYTPNKYTICDKCNFLVRPERAHHCRSCKKCVLKMDHHCPWIGTCVGERNLKYFFLFLSYGLLTTVYIAITISPKFILALHESESNKASDTLHHGALLITVCASLTMMIALVFMNCQYVYFISRNITVIESSYTDKNPYDLGTYNNWKMVFGEFKWKWFFPLTPENLYPTKDYLYPLNDIYLNINNVDMDDSFLASHDENSKEENV